MGSSAGRRDSTHIWWRNYFRATGATCHEPDCDKPGTIPDHDPPLSVYGGNKELWKASGGRYLPHCRYHSCKQGANITNTRHHPTPSRTW